MNKLKAIGLVTTLSLIGCNSFAASALDGLYVKALGGIALGNASGLNSVEPPRENISIVSSGIETTDQSSLFGAALGYMLPNSPISLELQALRINQQEFKLSTLATSNSKSYHEFSNINVRSNVYLLNALYSLPTAGNFTPFFGAGIGVAQNKVAGNFVSDTTSSWSGYWTDRSKTNFAYDLTAGVNYQVNEHVGISLAYQYLALGKLNTNDTVYNHTGESGQETLSANQYSSNNLMLGLSYKF